MGDSSDRKQSQAADGNAAGWLVKAKNGLVGLRRIEILAATPGITVAAIDQPGSI
jgi:hypothetical protein